MYFCLLFFGARWYAVGSADNGTCSRTVEDKKKKVVKPSFLVPGTGLEPALLSEHAPETCASTNSAIRAGRTSISRSLQKTRQQMLPSLLVPRTRLELARLNRHYPLKVACLPIPPPGLTSFSKAGAKVLLFSKTAKYFFYFVF